MPFIATSVDSFFCGSAITLVSYTLYKGDIKDYRFGLIGAGVFCGYIVIKHLIENVRRERQVEYQATQGQYHQ